MQLELGRVSDDRCWREVIDGCREVAAVEGIKEISYALDVPGSVLSNALAERERHALKAQHLPYFVRADKSKRIVLALAEHAGLQLAPTRAMTDAEKVARFEDALTKLPTEFARSFRELAFGRSR